MKSVRVIPVSAVLSRVPYEWLYLQKWVTPPLSRTDPPWYSSRSSVGNSEFQLSVCGKINV